MTAILDKTETSSIEALDFEKICEVKLSLIIDGKVASEVPCERPAAWVGNYPCCGHLSILCHHHTYEDPSTFWCIECEYEFPLSELVSLRPLK